jgi:hypothetical protein
VERRPSTHCVEFSRAAQIPSNRPVESPKRSMPVAPMRSAMLKSRLLIGAEGKPQIGFQFRRFPTPVALVFETLGLNRLWASNPVNRHWRALDSDTSQPADTQQPGHLGRTVVSGCMTAEWRIILKQHYRLVEFV